MQHARRKVYFALLAGGACVAASLALPGWLTEKRHADESQTLPLPHMAPEQKQQFHGPRHADVPHANKSFFEMLTAAYP